MSLPLVFSVLMEVGVTTVAPFFSLNCLHCYSSSTGVVMYVRVWTLQLLKHTSFLWCEVCVISENTAVEACWSAALSVLFALF